MKSGGIPEGNRRVVLSKDRCKLRSVEIIREEGKIHENRVNCGRFSAIRGARGLLAVREQVEKQAEIVIHSESNCSLAGLSYTRDSQVQITCETGREERFR